MEEIAAWVDVHTADLHRFAAARVGDRALADDLVQDTFLAAAEAIERFEARSAPRTWLFAILKRKIADHYRRKFKEPSVESLEEQQALGRFFDEAGNWRSDARPQEWATPKDDSLLDDPDFAATLSGCMGRLPAKWNAAMQLKYLEGSDTDKICTSLEITPANYWQILHRAKLQLRNCIENHWFMRTS